MKQIIVLTLALVGFVLSSYDENDLILSKFLDSPKELFKVYHLLFSKEKAYKLDSEEGIRRYKIFKENVKSNKAKNAELGREVYGITPFTDMTNEEFKEKMLMKPSQMEKLFGDKINLDLRQFKDTQFQQEPLNLDWTSQMTPIKDQGNCGSCWAFATMGAIEGNFNIKYQKVHDFSEQYLVDCDLKDGGCGGGWLTTAFEWVQGNGVLNELDYSYKAKRMLCDPDLRNTASDIMSRFDWCEGCEKSYWNSLLKNGPMVVLMDASNSKFKDYKPANNEPWNPTTCGMVNHAIVAVGSVMQDGKEMLIVRNSWGPGWGIKGYFRIPADNSCGIIRYAWYPVVKQPAPMPPKVCPIFYPECNFKGTSVSTCTGVANFKDSIGKSLKSFDIHGTKLDYWHLYPQPYCKGTFEYKYYDDAYCIEDGVPYYAAVTTQDTPSYNCIGLYEEPCKSGKRYDICDSISDLTVTPFKKVGSIVICSDTPIQAVVFFEGKKFSGNGYAIYLQETRNFEDEEAREAISKAQSVALLFKL